MEYTERGFEETNVPGNHSHPDPYTALDSTSSSEARGRLGSWGPRVRGRKETPRQTSLLMRSPYYTGLHRYAITGQTGEWPPRALRRHRMMAAGLDAT